MTVLQTSQAVGAGTTAEASAAVHPHPRSTLTGFLSRLPGAPTDDRSLWIDASGRVSGRFYACGLSSAFAPIVDAYDEHTMACQALLRSYAPQGEGLAPWKLFELAAGDEQLIALDRLCRTVHAINFLCSPDAPADLHLHVHGRLLCAVADDHGRAFRRVLESLGAGCDRFVITLPLSASQDMNLLQFVVANYRWNGFRVAVSAHGPDHARELADRLRPEFVRVPLARVDEAGCTAHDLGGELRSSGATLIATGVDDPASLPSSDTPNLVLGRGRAWPSSITPKRERGRRSTSSES